MTATSSTTFVVDVQSLQKLLTEKDAEIERLSFELEREKSLVSKACHEWQEDIDAFKTLCSRAADKLDGATKMVRTDSESQLIIELRKAAE